MQFPDCPWNRFVARATYQAPRLQVEEPLYALFWYYSEVNNGGHLQYFLNRDDPLEWELAVQTARMIGQPEVAETLAAAIACWKSAERNAPDTVEDYIEEALQGEFDAFDRLYYERDAEFMRAFESAVNDREEAGDASGD